VIVTNVTAANMLVTIGSSLIGANSVTVQGATSHDSAVVGNPISVGAVALSASQTAVNTGDIVRLTADLTGKQIVLPYSIPENFIVGTTANMTNTADVVVVATQSSGIRTFVNHLSILNSSAVGTWVNIKDGSTVIYTTYAASGGGGVSLTLPTPLRGSAATALWGACETTGSNTRITVVGYKGV
jgi:hypothetical protein